MMSTTPPAPLSPPQRRRSTREIRPVKLPQRILSLFHNQKDQEPILKHNMTKIHSSPNIYFIENFLNPSELIWFDTICTQHKNQFQSSFTEDDDGRKEVISEDRTSTYIHLSKSQDRVVRAIEQRASELVGMPSENVEPLQIVHYTQGQHFDVHHDAGTLLEDFNVIGISPTRIITLFIYLNNLPPGQGHTEFPLLEGNVSITPRKGGALLFCNVLADGTIDPRLAHCARPVDGDLIKYGINVSGCTYVRIVCS